MPTTAYPTTLDTFTDPAPGSVENVLSHAGQHDVLNDAVLQLETKLGAGGQGVRATGANTNVTTNQTVTPNLALGNILQFTLTASITVVNSPINAPAGGSLFTLIFIQGTGVNNTYQTFGAAYNLSGPNLGTLQQAGSFHSITFWWNGTNAWEVSRNPSAAGAQYNAEVYLNAATLSIANNTSTIFKFDTIRIGGDPTAMYAPGTGLFTVPVAGRYLFTASLQFANANAGVAAISVGPNAGNPTRLGAQFALTTQLSNARVAISSSVFLASGASLGVIAFQSSGAALNAQGDANGISSYCEVTYLGT